jgi:uncharacterized protein (TIGR01777 family)
VDSRVGPVSTLARAMAERSDGPRVLLSASAVGFYGDRGDERLTESSPPGAGFLAELCVQWEAATGPAADAGVRVATLRTGIVLTARGGALAQLRTIFRLGAGGPLAGGRQYMSWISLADEIAAMRHLLDHEVGGPVNLTGPDPVTNREFTRELATRLHRPAIFPVPAVALRVALGEFGNEAASGQRALPAVLTETGFAFSHPTLGAALDWALADR